MLAHADRLNSIISGLLTLSRIEQESDQREIKFEKSGIKNVLESAIAICQSKISKKDIKIDLCCDGEIEAYIDSTLLEQAMVNLIENAVEYSPSEQKVNIGVERTEGEILISVRDHGCGIAREHLPRIFERFYRVDKSRSRKLGGTGLGLAIVKHIAQFHGGRATVESSLGEGSTFSVYLPR